MSSHHIVREDQEPALIIEQIAGIPPALLDQLLEWSPLIITDIHNLTQVSQRGIHVDILVSNEPVVDLPQDHIRVLQMTHSFLDTALSYLIKRKCPAANIVSTDMRPDQLLRYSANIHAVLLGNGKRIFAARSGFSKWRPKGQSVFLYDEHVDVQGLQAVDNGEYVTTADGFYSIHFDRPLSLVGERL